MASGIDSATSALVLAAVNGGTAFTITTPLRCLFHTTTRSTDTGSDTEFTTANGYVRLAGSLASNPASPLTFAAAGAGAPSTSNSNTAVSVVNMPAGTWTGCSIADSHAASRNVADGVTTNASTTITSATISFVAGDVGAIVTVGSALPTNTVIVSVTNSTTAVVSQAATGTTSAQTITVLKLTGQQVTFWASLASSKTVNLGDTVTVPSGSWQTSLA